MTTTKRTFGSASAKCSVWAALGLATLMLGIVTLSPSEATPKATSLGGPHHSAQQTTASVVTGSYDGPNNSGLYVLQLPGGRIRFDLQAYGPSSPLSGPNMGESSGFAVLRQGVAVYHNSLDPDQPGNSGGRLTMRFQNGRVRVSEEGELGYGAGVSADGTYIRHSRKPPKFDKDGQAI